MSIFSVLTLIGGLAFFLFGMNIMSSNQRLASNATRAITNHTVATITFDARIIQLLTGSVKVR